jgi:Holliday junction resolvase RusA-like endonuclease
MREKRKIKFKINGNQEDPKGNPVPYVRYTQGGYWKPFAKRYNEWKDYVQGCFYKATEAKEYQIIITKRRITKPIILSKNQKAVMNIKIFWKNNAHGDPDNVWKGIADALFENDKNLDGSFESMVDPDNPRVEVEIVINP